MHYVCIVPDTCPTGYYGEMCLNKCLCECDQTTGACLADTCFSGYHGANCGIECHCLNDAPCDKESGRCAADIDTGLSLCQPGYVSSSGINLDNCQQCKHSGVFGR